MAAPNNKKKPIELSKWKQKGNFKVVVGIDFGTDGSGIGWSIVGGDGQVFTDQQWNQNSRFVDVKTKTNILLDDQGNFVAFGRKATEQYIRQFEDMSSDDDDDNDNNDNKNDDNANKFKKYMYFSNFKMALYKRAIKKKYNSHVTGGAGGAVGGGAVVDDNDNKNNNDNNNNNNKKKGPDASYKTNIKNDLTATNGATWPSSKVFVEALKFMRRHAFAMFKNKNVIISDASEVQWVLTVPAIWNDKAKGLMEKWATEAGLIQKNKKIINQLVIAYEPDCASISIQNEIKDYKKLRNKNKQQLNNVKNVKNDDKPDNDKTKEYLSAGERYILLDLGGGTADIACHQVIDDFTVKEVYQPSGGAWGSTAIDKHFMRLFADMFPKGWIQEFQAKYPSSYTSLRDHFRRSKETFYARDVRGLKNTGDPSTMNYDDNKAHNVTLPVDLVEFLDEKLEPYNEILRLKNFPTYSSLSDYMMKQDFLGAAGRWRLNDDKLELHYSIWTTMFDSIIDRIIDHCKNLLKLPSLNNKQCKYICLVGGFSASRYLQSRIMYELGVNSKYRLIVIIPRRPALSVVDGAVRLGLKPDYIKSRKLRQTYGIKVNAPLKKYDTSKLDPVLLNKNKYWNQRAKQEYLHNIFHTYVRKGNEISITDKPKTTQFYASKKNIVGIEVFASDDKNPIFITGKSIAKKDVILPPNWDIHNTFPISFFFGDTTIRVFAGIDGIDDKDKEIKLDYTI